MMSKHGIILATLICFLPFGFLNARPVIEVEPQSIEDELATGDVSHRQLTITNRGDSPLRYSLRKNIIQEPQRELGGAPRRDEPGDLLAAIQAPYNNTIALAWDDDHQWMWCINHGGPGVLYAFDPAAGQVVAEFGIGDGYGGLIYRNGVLFVDGRNNSPNEIRRFNVAGERLESLQTPFDLGESSIDSDGDHLFVQYWQGAPIGVYNMVEEPGGEWQQVGSIDYSGALNGASAYVSEWVPGHPRGRLWLYGDGSLYQCRVDANWNCELVQDFQTVGGQWAGLEHDGVDLWLAWFNGDGNWYMIDDGMVEVNWLTFEPKQGELAEGDNVEIDVVLNATACTGGEYVAELHINSNDDQNADFVVDVRLTVDAAPIIVLVGPFDEGFDGVLDFNRIVGEDLFTGSPYGIPLTVRNDGASELVVEDVSSDNADFSADPAAFDLEPGASQVVQFILNAQEDGLHQGTMTITSNAHNIPVGVISLRGVTTSPPNITVTPQSFDARLANGEVQESDLDVSNDGDAPLRWNFEIQGVDQGGEIQARGRSAVSMICRLHPVVMRWEKYWPHTRRLMATPLHSPGTATETGCGASITAGRECFMHTIRPRSRLWLNTRLATVTEG